MTCGKSASDLAEAPPQAPIVVEQARPITAELSDFATGAAEQNEVYIGNRLSYDRGVEEMDPVRNIRVAAQLFLQFILFVAAPLILAAAFGFVALVCLIFDQVADNPLTSALGAIARILSLLAFLAAGVCGVIGLFRRVPVGNAEWVMFLDDKGPAAPAVFAHVASAFQRRRTPAQTVRVKRVGLPGGGHRDMLEVRYGVFTGYVTAYEFGNDLHIGWTYFWQLSIVRLILLAISNLLNALRGRQSEVHVLARYEPAKTMREALHAAAREGVDVAGSPTRMGAAIPTTVPVDAVAAMDSDGTGLFAT
jgi:hypothetical protein